MHALLEGFTILRTDRIEKTEEYVNRSNENTIRFSFEDKSRNQAVRYFVLRRTRSLYTRSMALLKACVCKRISASVYARPSEAPACR